MNAVHPSFKDEISSLAAMLGVVAGLTQEQREAVINRPSLSNAHFIQKCNSWYLASHQEKTENRDNWNCVCVSVIT